MSIKVVLFDLDGTLLPIDQSEFIKQYFKGLVTCAAMHGYDIEAAKAALSQGIKYIATNDGSRSGEVAFWDGFCEVIGEERSVLEGYFEKFYQNDFDKLISLARPTEKARATVEAVKALGLRVVLATSPYFPRVATYKRVRWAGFEPTDFELVTTYENSCHAKPAIEYYSDLAKTLGVAPEECLMVGNDAFEDMIAENIGMKVSLMPDCLINSKDIDISKYPQGDFDALTDFVKTLI